MKLPHSFLSDYPSGHKAGGWEKKMSGQNSTGQVRNERRQRFHKSALVSITFIVALSLTTTRLQASTVNISPGDNIPSIVSSNPPGTTFVIHAGTYRLLAGHIVAKSGDVFTGQPGAILSGAKLLTSFHHSGNYYYVTGQAQNGRVTIPVSNCVAGFPGCIYPEDLYFDSVPLQHVDSLSDVGPGTWFFDYSAQTKYFYV
jgi:hypothetical protein